MCNYDDKKRACGRGWTFSMTEELSCGKVNEEKYSFRAIDVLMFSVYLYITSKNISKPAGPKLSVYN